MRKALAGLVLALIAFLGMAAPALADTLTVRELDTTGFPEVKVRVLVTGAEPSLGSFRVRENDRLVNKFDVLPLGKTQTPVGIVLVIDTSGSMKANDKMSQAKAAAKRFITQRQPNEQIAIVAFNESAQLVANFSSDSGVLAGIVDGLVARGETALFDAIRLGAGLFGERPDLQPNMVILSDGADTVSSTTADQAKASVISAKSTGFAIGLPGGDFDSGPLKSIATATGGEYVETSDPTTLESLYGRVRVALQNQYEITYTSTPASAERGSVDVAITAGNVQGRATASVDGGLARGTNAAPIVEEPSNMPGFLTGDASAWFVGALVLFAAGLLAYGLILVFVRDRSNLETAMSSYDTSFESPDTTEGEDDGSLADTAIVRRAIDTTARIAEERGVLQRVEKLLDQADLPLRPAELIFFGLALGLIMTILGFALGSLVGGVLCAAIFGLGPWAVLSFMASRRQRAFTSQLPDMLQLLAGSLRAGYSLLQGVDAVAQQVGDPMGKELRRALGEARLGRPVEDALADVATRMGSPDFDWAIMAVRIQREVGGNLAELLMTVSDTMIARERLRREVRALTAEGRISAIVLGILPLSLGVLLFFLNRDYMQKLFDDGLGQAMLGGSIILALGGFYWMKKTIEIEI